MKAMRFPVYPGRLYSVTAAVSLALFFGALVHKGSDGPFGPPLHQMSSDAAEARSTEVFEIVYFGSSNCPECETWKKNHLSRWRQAALSREIRLTMRTASCSGAAHYARLCKVLGAQASTRPTFALIHRETGRVLADGEGIGGFYMVARKARKWQETWAEQRTTA